MMECHGYQGIAIWQCGKARMKEEWAIGRQQGRGAGSGFSTDEEGSRKRGAGSGKAGGRDRGRGAGSSGDETKHMIT